MLQTRSNASVFFEKKKSTKDYVEHLWLNQYTFTRYAYIEYIEGMLRLDVTFGFAVTFREKKKNAKKLDNDHFLLKQIVKLCN